MHARKMWKVSNWLQNEADLDDCTTWYQWKRVEQMVRKKKRKESEKGQEDA